MPLLFTLGCSHAVKPNSPEDTPKNHYLSGMKLLGDKDTAIPEAEFLRAIALDGKSPLGYAGIAALEMNRRNYRRALRFANKALDRNQRFIEALVLKGRIITERKKSGWYGKAKATYQRALEVDPENESALYYSGETSLEAYRFEEARGCFLNAAAKNGTFALRASERAALTVKILEGNPRTGEGRRVVLSDTLTRADICSLLLLEFELKNVLKRHRLVFFESTYNNADKRRELPQDMEERPNRHAVLDILILRLPDLDVYPNGNFYPGRPVNRAQFAMIIQEILEILFDDQTLSTRYAAADSPFPDVRQDFYAFNAIMTVAELGIMSPDEETEKFDTDNIVSGSEALLIIRALERALLNY